MKSNKTIIALTACAMMTVGSSQTQAGDREWATAGKILTGVVAGSILTRALECNHAPPTTVVYAPAQPTLVYAPAPTVVYAAAPQTVVYARPAMMGPPPPPVFLHPRPMMYRYPVVVRYEHRGGRYYHGR